MILQDVCVNTNVFPVNLTNQPFQYLDYTTQPQTFFSLSFISCFSCAHNVFSLIQWELHGTLFCCCPVYNQGAYQKPFVMHYRSLWERFIFLPPPSPSRTRSEQCAGSAEEQHCLELLKIQRIAQEHFSRAGARYCGPQQQSFLLT